MFLDVPRGIEKIDSRERVLKSTFKQLVCTLCSYHFTGEEELATSNDPSPHSDVTHAYCHYYRKVNSSNSLEWRFF